MTISYKGLCILRQGRRIAVVREDGDVLGTFLNWGAAFAFIDRVKGDKPAFAEARW